MGILFWTVLASLVRESKRNSGFGQMIVTSMFTSKFFGEEERYLVNDVSFNIHGNDHVIDHILVYHKGLFMMNVVHINGTVKGEANQNVWEVTYGGQVMELPNPLIKLILPLKQAYILVGNGHVPHPIVVFTNENKPEGAGKNVINFSELKDYIINFPKDEQLTSEQMQELYMVFKNYKDNNLGPTKEDDKSVDDDKHSK